MKKLQNDLTTIEQSKRLLELDVPKVTANYYYDSRDFKPQAHEVRGHWNEEDDYASRHGYKITPLWSVGRLIEIWNICVNLIPGMDLEFSPSSNSYIEDLVRDFEFAGEDSLIDFSKLEE